MKRLVCCLDGTWNDDKDEGLNTNVVKLHRAVLPSDGQGVQQLSHYVVGVGTAYQGRLRFWIGASGIEVGERVKDGYRLLAESYEPGDEIYLFGFSRGAFEARSLANFVALFGIPTKGGAFSIDEAWRLYRRPASKRDPARLAQLREAAHCPAHVKCVGVWDTVGNLGNPLSPGGWLSGGFKFHDMRLHEAVDVGLHALSIDEVRGPFRPALMTVDRGTALPKNQHIEQVWFPGTHANVGGGVKDTALSDIALLWMAERVTATTGLAFDMPRLRQTTRPDAQGLQESVVDEGIYRLTALIPFVRLLMQNRKGVALLRRLLLRSWRTGRLDDGKVSVNESVHESALARFGKTVPEMHGWMVREIVYRPRNLKAALPKPQRAT